VTQYHRLILIPSFFNIHNKYCYQGKNKTSDCSQINCIAHPFQFPIFCFHLLIVEEKKLYQGEKGHFFCISILTIKIQMNKYLNYKQDKRNITRYLKYTLHSYAEFLPALIIPNEHLITNFS